MANTVIKQSLTAHKIGPLDRLDHTWLCGEANSTVVYARNGSGKTFLSRMFRLAEKGDAYSSEQLLKLGERSGSFCLSIDGAKKLCIEVQLGKPVKVTGGEDLLFHAFNSDYVEDTVVKNDFKAPIVDRYIVGAGNIDLAIERAEVEMRRGEVNQLNADIDAAVGSMKQNLKAVGVSSNSKSFRGLTRDSVLAAELSNSEVDTSRARLEALKSIPDDDPSVSLRKLVVDENLMADVRRVLSTEYSRASFAEQFIKKVNARRGFVEEGLSYLDESKKCPFCG